MSRIIAGTYGGRRLSTPDGTDTRPTSDRVREALFSSLDAANLLYGHRFLDLYAGSGAVGLEAASRGAASVLLVESGPPAARVLRANIEALGLRERCRLATAKVAAVLAGPAVEPFDVVFADPPYALDEDELAGVLGLLAERGWLAPDAVLVVERSVRSPEPRWPEGVTAERARRYGESVLWYGRRS